MLIFFSNQNVGSAIENSGNIIKEWIDDVKDDSDILIEYKHQTAETYTFSKILELKPKIFVLNSLRSRIIRAVWYYKECIDPEVKIYIIIRVAKDIPYLKIEPEIAKDHILKSANCLLIVNQCHRKIDYLSHYNTIDACGFCNPDVFKITTPWNERKRKFLHIGSLHGHKLSEEFLTKINGTDINIDVYGKYPSDPLYTKIFEKCKNINYLGYVEPQDVPNIFNQYKYFILPHNGYEPLCNTLMESISCGTIPLVVNDREGNFDYAWIDWANGLYYGCYTVDEYILNLKMLDDLGLISIPLRFILSIVAL